MFNPCVDCHGVITKKGSFLKIYLNYIHSSFGSTASGSASEAVSHKETALNGGLWGYFVLFCAFVFVLKNILPPYRECEALPDLVLTEYFY